VLHGKPAIVCRHRHPRSIPPEAECDIRDVQQHLHDAIGEKHPLAKSVGEILASLDDPLSFEGSHDPEQMACDALLKRLPKILEFTADYRDLQLPYNVKLKTIDDVKQRKQPSRPFKELLTLAGLDLDELMAADNRNDHATKLGLLEDANSKLRDLCAGRWSQSDAYLRFDWRKPIIDLVVVQRKGLLPRDRFNALSERSDGYRQFVALLIFVLLRKIDGAILIVDEIEQHLHYDAQADVIQMMTAEEKIGKVI
jgi:predicted ATP-dependent endonuclease of OLD family